MVCYGSALFVGTFRYSSEFWLSSVDEAGFNKHILSELSVDEISPFFPCEDHSVSD